MKVKIDRVIRETQHPDKLLLVSLEDLALSEGFHAFVDRLRVMRDQHMRELVTAKEPTEVYRTQGKVEAIESIMRLRDVLRGELKGKIKLEQVL